MRKLFFAALHLLMAAILLPACAAAQPDCTKTGVLCVGLVTEVGSVNDKSFNQLAWEGVQNARRDGYADWVQYIETSDAKDYDQNIAPFAEAGYSLIVTVGADMGDATRAAASQYPNTRFIGVDQFQDPSKPTSANLVGLNFPEDQAGFLVGALAALMSQSHQIGAVCGNDALPADWRYCEGFKAGAAYADQRKGTRTQVTVVYHDDVGLDQSFLDQPWGAATADAMVKRGVDVVFGAGGETGNGAIIAAAQRGADVIGADTDQYLTLPVAAPKMITSAIKLIAPGVEDLIRATRNGQFPSGNYTGKAGFAHFHDQDSNVPADVKELIRQIYQGILDGSVQTGVLGTKPVP
jgi:basic membrane protein A